MYKTMLQNPGLCQYGSQLIDKLVDRALNLGREADVEYMLLRVTPHMKMPDGMKVLRWHLGLPNLAAAG